MKFNKIIFFILLVSALIGISTTLTDDFEISKNLELFSNIYKDVNVNYVDEIDPEKMMEYGLVAMLRSLDPYTVYIPAEEVAQFQSSITGNYAGFGASINSSQDTITITEVYENSPAKKAGLRAGDKIFTVNERLLNTIPQKERSTLLRGPAGSKVKVDFLRPHIGTMKAEVIREEIKVANVPYYDIISDDIAYICLSTFSENAGKNVQNRLQELKARKKITSVILDLRGNSGGLLIEAINVVKVFVEKGTPIVSVKSKNKEKQNTYRTLNQPLDANIPLVVLIDEQSASASEIVAGAIQDLDRGVIIGKKSFGKGLVQNTRDLPYGGKIKLTTSRYHIPSGRCIQSSNYMDGKTVSIADSLYEKFKTVGGRVVYDRGGISPDISIETKELADIIKLLNRQNLIFEFAVNFSNTKKINKIEELKLTDSDFEDFISYLEKININQKSDFEKSIQQLESKLLTENLDTELKSEMDLIKNSLKNERIQKIRKYKKQILSEIQSNICLNLFLKKETLKNSIDQDLDISMASEILKNNQRYNSILEKK
jgi:carboxyl-terminal processing protease